MCKPSYLKKVIHVALAAVSVSLYQPSFADEGQVFGDDTIKEEHTYLRPSLLDKLDEKVPL